MFSIRSFLGVKKEDSALLASAYLGFFCSGMMANVLGCIMPFLREAYGFDYTFQGTLSSVNQIGNLMAVWLSIFLPFLVGRKNSTILMGSGIVIGLLLMAFSSNPIVLILAFILVGMGRGTMSNITNVIVGRCAENKGAGLNLLHATFAIGAVISPSIVALLGHARWKMPLIGVSMLSLGALIFFFCTPLENTRGKNSISNWFFPKAFSFWLNVSIMFCYLCCETSMMSWLVTYLKDSGIFSSQMSNLMSALLWISILSGRIICANISCRVNKSGLILTLGVLFTFFYTLVIISSTPWIIMIGIVGMGLAMSGIFPTTLSTQDKRYSGAIDTGISIAFPTIGAILMPVLIGNVASKLGIKAGMATMYLALILLVILAMVKLFYSKAQKKKLG